TFKVHWAGSISGMPDTAGHEVRLHFQYANPGWDHSVKLDIDARGNFRKDEWFRNVVPTCVDLELDGDIVDRYCGVDGHDRYSSKVWILRNVFDSTEVIVAREKERYLVEGLAFTADHARKDPRILRFL